MGDPAIRLEGVTKSFRTRFRRREVLAVDDLTLEVEPGSVIALIGPNGAGKTTTLFLLLGLLKPESGAIRIFGEPAGSVEALGRVGFMSEIFHTYPFHTARRAIAFYGRLSGADAQTLEPGIPDLLARVGLGKAVDRKVGKFSKGMIQRLGLAQALFHRPDLLLLDEPTTGLDPEGRRLVSHIIAEEQEKGTTVFLSSHILSDVERQCDSVVMIREGRILFSKALSELTGRSDEWELEVFGVSQELRGALSAAGFPVIGEDDGSSVIRCTSSRKDELLRALIEASVKIGEIRNTSRSLEDLYMQYVDDS